MARYYKHGGRYSGTVVEATTVLTPPYVEGNGIEFVVFTLGTRKGPVKHVTRLDIFTERFRPYITDAEMRGQVALARILAEPELADNSNCKA